MFLLMCQWHSVRERNVKPTSGSTFFEVQLRSDQAWRSSTRGAPILHGLRILVIDIIIHLGKLFFRNCLQLFTNEGLLEVNIRKNP